MSASLKAVARALAARREGRLEKAREFYQDALDKVPGFIEAEKGLAEVTYIIGMGQGEKAEKSGDWFQARNAYRFALEARRGDPSARARLDWVNMHLAELARRFQGVFLVPDGKEDPFGNPVVRRNGASSDPVSGLPTELWLVDPLMEFVLIPAGSFSMGSPADENGRHPNEGPVHPVSLARPFYIGKYEVTQVQWKALMNRNPSTQTGDRHPVENVSWEDCLAFTARLDQRLRKVRPRLHPGLPSEAEWEYACRAGSSTLYCNGDTTEGLARVAWYFDTAEGRTHPVGLLKPNAWGLYDVHGNVYEWTMDGHHSDYRGAPADGAPWNGVGHPGIRMLRGGAARATARQCRSAYRWILNGSDRADDKGLRIVLRTGSK
jgi:formylglycine-generating enzyme required for sulfatase activity